MNKPEWGPRATYRETLEPAMEITDQVEADVYFEALVQHLTTHHIADRAEAERVTKINLGYYAGYYGADVRERVERLFRCVHPVFGAIAKEGAPTADQALAAGVRASRGGL